MITVVTSAFNPGDQILRLGEALSLQTDTKLRWLVVDDGSLPEYKHNFSLLEERYPSWAKVITLPNNIGQAAARNVALKLAGDDFVSIIDADDRPSHDYFRQLLSAAKSCCENNIAYFASTKHIYENPKHNWTNHTYQELDAQSSQLPLFLERPFFSHCGILFPPGLLMEMGGYNESLSTDEDGELIVRMMVAGWEFRPAQGPVYEYYHYKDTSSVSTDDSLEKILARFESSKYIFELLVANNLLKAPETKESLCRRFDQIALSARPIDKSLSSEILHFAREIYPSYRWSGGKIERFIRKIAGIDALLALKRFWAIRSQLTH